MLGHPGSRSGRFAVDDFPGRALRGDGDRARLHGLGQLSHQIDMQKTMLQSSTLHDDMVGELEAALEAARGDAAMKISRIRFLAELFA